jgi:hypothetical protein
MVTLTIKVKTRGWGCMNKSFMWQCIFDLHLIIYSILKKGGVALIKVCHVSIGPFNFDKTTTIYPTTMTI